MCLILLAHRVHPDYRLVLAANRDEFHSRATAPAHFWKTAPGVFGGLDLQSGGSWLAVTRTGRWAAVTNYRDPLAVRAAAPSRGHLVGNFVTGDAAPFAYAAELQPRASEYNGFNLLVGDEREVVWTSNRVTANAPSLLGIEPGIHGISNHLLNTPWPKVVTGRAAMRQLIENRAPLGPDRLLDLLLDRGYAADHELPDTGVGPELERALSSRFVTTPEYGTRSSTAILIPYDGPVLFAERRYDPAGGVTGETRQVLRAGAGMA